LHGIFIIGTAGSGKTLMAASLAEWLSKQGKDTAIVNLDPGVLNVPYKPDVDVRDYVSTLFLSSAVHLRFMLPQLNLLTKMDLMDEKVVREILEWSRSPARLREALAKQGGEVNLLAEGLFRTVGRLRLDFSTIACSAKYFTNFLNVQAAIERILTRGEKEE